MSENTTNIPEQGRKARLTPNIDNIVNFNDNIGYMALAAGFLPGCPSAGAPAGSPGFFLCYLST